MINNYYVDSVDAHKMVEDAINGVLSKLDPHSAYTNAAETKKLNEPLSGSFDGIGVQFNMLEDTLVVIQPVPKGPSEKVGILAGDRIVHVNDTAIAGVKMSREEIMRRLRGPKGTKVNLDIVRRSIADTLRFEVIRDKIPVNSVDAAYMVTPTIGLIRFNNFAQTTHDEIVEALHKLQDQGMKDLILDLQQNGGGYLQAAAEIASEFLEKGDMIVYTRGRNVPAQEFRSTGGDPRRRTILMQGFVINIVNPTIWIYWVSVITLVTGEFNLSIFERYIFFIGVLGTTLGIDVLKCKLASLLQQIITAKVLNRTNKVCSFILFAFAAYLVISMVLYQTSPKAREREQQPQKSTEMIKNIHNRFETTPAHIHAQDVVADTINY